MVVSVKLRLKTVSQKCLSVKTVLTLRVKLPCRKCKIFVLSFIVSEKIEQKKMDDALAIRFKNKIAIHR